MNEQLPADQSQCCQFPFAG